MRLYAIAIVFVLGWVRGPVAQQGRARGRSTLVTIDSYRADSSPKGVSRNDCAVIADDGNVYLERRSQKVEQDFASIGSYEIQLSGKQLQRLQEIVDGQDVVDLPPFVSPSAVTGLSWFHVFRARIIRPEGSQDVGFFSWRPEQGRPDTSPASTPIRVKQAWQISEPALQPLIQWLSQIEDQPLMPAKVKSGMCDGVEAR